MGSMADTKIEQIREEAGGKWKNVDVSCRQCFQVNGGCSPLEINCFYEGCDDLATNADDHFCA